MRPVTGDTAVWPVELFGEETAEGWDRAVDVGCAMQGSRLERGSKGTGGCESENAGPPLCTGTGTTGARCAGADRTRL